MKLKNPRLSVTKMVSPSYLVPTAHGCNAKTFRAAIKSNCSVWPKGVSAMPGHSKPGSRWDPPPVPSRLRPAGRWSSADKFKQGLLFRTSLSLSGLMLQHQALPEEFFKMCAPWRGFQVPGAVAEGEEHPGTSGQCQVGVVPLLRQSTVESSAATKQRPLGPLADVRVVCLRHGFCEEFQVGLRRLLCVLVAEPHAQQVLRHDLLVCVLGRQANHRS